MFSALIKKSKTVAVLLCLCVFVSGCHSLLPSNAQPVAKSSGYSVEDTQQMASSKGLDYRPDHNSRDASNEGLDDIPLLVKPSNIHKGLNDYADQLAMSLMDNAFSLKQSDLIAVASFVRFNHTLREPTVLGNRLAEAMIAELQEYGMTIVDTKLAKGFAVTAYGDLAFSRNVKQLQKHVNVDYILTGTLVERGDSIDVNARIIAVDSQAVAAAATIRIPGFIVANEHYFSYGE